MINLDDITKENKAEQNPNWSYIPDHPYRILIIGCSGSRQTNTSINKINHQTGIEHIALNEIYLYAKDP